MRTPWFASKYGTEKLITFARCAVIVVSSSAKSNFFGPASRIVPNGARRSWTFFVAIPSCFAIASPSEYSKPDGFLIVDPVGCPFQKAGAGTSNPTTSLPGDLVGGAAVLPAEAATAVTANAAAARTNTIRLTTSSLISACGARM